jgi:hypothetical protein
MAVGDLARLRFMPLCVRSLPAVAGGTNPSSDWLTDEANARRLARPVAHCNPFLARIRNLVRKTEWPSRQRRYKNDARWAIKKGRENKGR